MSEYSNLLEPFTTIGLHEMKNVELLNRVDTKFIFHQDQLKDLLNQLQSHYSILEIDSQLVTTYKNLYFDTENLDFYKAHHNERTNRMKIRIRKYMETDVCYIEVKRKNNKGRTDKKRRQIQEFEKQFSSNTVQFLNQYANNVIDLQPSLWNEFKRITFVNLENRERITIDLDLAYDNEASVLNYDNLVIAELKQPVFNRNSTLFRILKSMHINPYRVSKYCLGMASMNKELKQNAFKEKVLRIHKITQ